MTFHRSLKRFFVYLAFELKPRIQGVKFEEIPVGAGRRAGLVTFMFVPPIAEDRPATHKIETMNQGAGLNGVLTLPDTFYCYLHGLVGPFLQNLQVVHDLDRQFPIGHRHGLLPIFGLVGERLRAQLLEIPAVRVPDLVIKLVIHNDGKHRIVFVNAVSAEHGPSAHTLEAGQQVIHHIIGKA